MGKTGKICGFESRGPFPVFSPEGAECDSPGLRCALPWAIALRPFGAERRAGLSQAELADEELLRCRPNRGGRGEVDRQRPHGLRRLDRLQRVERNLGVKGDLSTLRF